MKSANKKLSKAEIAFIKHIISSAKTDLLSNDGRTPRQKDLDRKKK